jgi:hypothetical protein
MQRRRRCWTDAEAPSGPQGFRQQSSRAAREAKARTACEDASFAASTGSTARIYSAPLTRLPQTPYSSSKLTVTLAASICWPGAMLLAATSIDAIRPITGPGIIDPASLTDRILLTRIPRDRA